MAGHATAKIISRARKNPYPYFFLAPYLLGSAILILIPLVITLGLSFTQYDIFSPPQFKGLVNYSHFFTDPLFQRALYNSFWFILIAVPLRVLAALALAIRLGVHTPRRINELARAAAYLPTIIPDVAYALVWLVILNPGFGPLNLALSALGLPTHAWLIDPFTARMSIVAMFGFQFGEGFVLLLAARQMISTDLIEAAALDGASRAQIFRRVLLPLMMPALLLLTIRDTVLSFQSTFAPALIATETGPYYATYFLPHYIFDESFGLFKYGYGSAVTVVLYALTAVFIVIEYRLMRRSVRANEN